MKVSSLLRGRSGRVRSRATALLAVVAVVGTLNLAFVASSASASSKSKAHSDVAAARAAVAALSKSQIAMPFPKTSVKPGKHTVAIIATGLAAFGTEILSQYLQQAVTAIGWTAPPTYDGKFQPTTQSALIEQAVNSGAQALVLEAINPTTVASAIALANSKNIPIVCVNCGPSLPKGMINIEMSPQKVGIAQANYIIAKSNGKAKVFVDADQEFQESILQTNTAVQTLRKKCPGCTIHEFQTLSTDLKVPGFPAFASVLANNPAGTINWVLVYSDSAALPEATLAQQDGRTDVNFIGFQGAPPYVAAIASSNPSGAKATIAIPIPFFAYAAMDELARSFAHKPLWNASELPVGIIDAADYSHFNLSAPFEGPKIDFVTQFQKLWGRG